MTDVNHETGTTRDLVTKTAVIDVVGESRDIVVMLPRYVNAALTEEDWTFAGNELRKRRDDAVTEAMVYGGGSIEAVRTRIAGQLRRDFAALLYHRFKIRQLEAGNEAWAVPPTMQGMRYATNG